MDVFAERTVRLVNPGGDKRWALQEFDGDGKPVGSPWEMWHWSVKFRCSLQRAITLEGDQDSEVAQQAAAEHHAGTAERIRDAEDVRPMPATFDDRLFGRMRVIDTKLTMFGTGRELRDLTLLVHPWDGEQAKCHVFAALSYESEIDFRRDTVDDHMQVQLWLPRAQYEAMCEATLLPHARFGLRLRGATGFYSQWTHGVTTSEVKVMPEGDDLTIENPDGLTARPWHVGEVLGFALDAEIGGRRKGRAKRKGRGVKRAAPQPPPAPVPPPPQPSLPNLKTPLWIAVVLLGLLLFK